MLTVIDYNFSKRGFNQIVKQTIIEYIHKWGINFNNLDDYGNRIQIYVYDLLKISLNSSEIESYISILLFVINNYLNLKVKDSLKFFFKEDVNIGKLKKIIMIMDIIRKFLELPTETLHSKLKLILLERRIKNWNQQNQANLYNFTLNLLKSVLEYGYGILFIYKGNYSNYLYSNTLKTGFLSQKDFVNFLGFLINDTYKTNKKQLIDELEEFFNEVEAKLLNI